jgi:hypothetical protein
VWRFDFEFPALWHADQCLLTLPLSLGSSCCDAQRKGDRGGRCMSVDAQGTAQHGSEIALCATAQSRANIIASAGRAGRCAEVACSMSSWERDAGGLTAIMVAPAKRTVATAIFKHVDIKKSLPPYSLRPQCRLACTRKKIWSLTCEGG